LVKFSVLLLVETDVTFKSETLFLLGKFQ